MVLFFILFLGRQVLLTPKHLSLNQGLSYFGNLHLLVPLPLSESKDQE